MHRTGCYIALSLSIVACARGSAPHDTRIRPWDAQTVQAISLLGDTLGMLPLSIETRARYQNQLSDARSAYDRSPNDADSIVWLGRRLAYLGRFREAIDVFSRGIRIHPENPWFYRHRGHRYISLREFGRGITDFERATKLVQGKPDIIEPDGQPNAQNMPIGTLHSNIDYHLALAHYLKGDFARAIPIYRRELDMARNDDRRVSIAHWYYMALRRLGRDSEAAQLLAQFERPMQVIENDSYRDLIRMYRGEIPADSVLALDATGQMSVANATAAYGIANWHLYNGRRDEGIRILRRIIAGGQWGAFGYIAAEAELARSAPRS